MAFRIRFEDGFALSVFPVGLVPCKKDDALFLLVFEQDVITGVGRPGAFNSRSFDCVRGEMARRPRLAVYNGSNVQLLECLRHVDAQLPLAMRTTSTKE